MDTITICLGSSCYARGNNILLDLVRQFLSDNGLEDKVILKGELCSTHCSCGPNIRIGDVLISELDEQKVLSELIKYFNI